MTVAMKPMTPTQKARIAFERATKLSQILALALADIKKAEKDPTCKIDMGAWRQPKDAYHETCFVCLAGAVMRARFPKTGLQRFPGVADALEEIRPSCFDLGLQRKFHALNRLRTGMVAAAIYRLTGRYDASFLKLDRDVVDYERNHALWHKQMVKLLADLKKAGL